MSAADQTVPVRLANPYSGRYAHIDALRAFAVLLVVVAHAGLSHIVPGGSGVTIFFAISGFIITHLVLKEHARSGAFDVAHFYVRRVLKLAPPFIVIVAVPTAIYALWHPVRLTDFLSQVFFAFNWIYMSGDYQVLPGSGVVWSLAVEEQFYIAFALLWLAAIRSRNRLGILATVACLAALGSLLLRVYIAETAFSHNRTFYGTDTRIDGIAIGVLSAVMFFWSEQWQALASRFRRIFASDWAAALAVCAYLFSLVYRDEYFRETFRYSIQAVAASVLVLYGLLQTKSAARRALQRVAELWVVQRIGLASYSIYLVHLSLNSLLSPLATGWSKPLTIMFFSVSGITVGVLIWWLVELPVERLKNRLGTISSRASIAATT